MMKTAGSTWAISTRVKPQTLANINRVLVALGQQPASSTSELVRRGCELAEMWGMAHTGVRPVLDKWTAAQELETGPAKVPTGKMEFDETLEPMTDPAMLEVIQDFMERHRERERRSSPEYIEQIKKDYMANLEERERDRDRARGVVQQPAATSVDSDESQPLDAEASYDETLAYRQEKEARQLAELKRAMAGGPTR